MEFNVPFQHKYGYIRDDSGSGSGSGSISGSSSSSSSSSLVVVHQRRESVSGGLKLFADPRWLQRWGDSAADGAEDGGSGPVWPARG